MAEAWAGSGAAIAERNRPRDRGDGRIAGRQHGSASSSPPADALGLRRGCDPARVERARASLHRVHRRCRRRRSPGDRRCTGAGSRAAWHVGASCSLSAWHRARRVRAFSLGSQRADQCAGRAVRVAERPRRAAGALSCISTAYVAGTHTGQFSEDSSTSGRAFATPTNAPSSRRRSWSARGTRTADPGLRHSIVVGERSSGWTARSTCCTRR